VSEATAASWRYPIVVGAKLKVKDGEVVKNGQMLASGIPRFGPDRASGAVKYGDSSTASPSVTSSTSGPVSRTPW
jgi:hypothetical protein